MNNKLDHFNKLKTELEGKLTSKVPVKHKDHPETYKNFLKNELEIVNNTISKMKGLS